MNTTPRHSRAAELAHYHPLLIEGMGGYDPRNPAPIAAAIAAQLRARWSVDPPSKPVLLITQGDPIETHGIAAITRLVADELGVSRALIFLDADIADDHRPSADRYQVILEIPYSELATTLREAVPNTLTAIEAAVETELAAKQSRRRAQGKPDLQDYYQPFALLQEVSKVACKHLCGEITVAHTSSDISDFSVTSFYTVGLALGLIDARELQSFSD